MTVHKTDFKDDVKMQYMGGKQLISTRISEVINHEISRIRGGATFVSLFCGACSIESKIKADTKILNDKHEYLIEMFKALQNGYELPDEITKEQYEYIKNNLDEDKALSGFVGFACSFGGKWFGGYARDDKRGRNYTQTGKRGLIKKMAGLQNATFISMDYKEVIIPNGSVVYADPPYANTTAYGSKFKIDYDDFWDYMREISKNNIVFISEEHAPDDFECVWQKEVVRTLDKNLQNRPKKIEKLFKYRNA